MFTPPDSLTWWRTRPRGAAWLEALPGTVEGLTQTWAFELGPAFDSGSASGRARGYVAEAVLADGTRAVLKLNPPLDEDTLLEPDALTFWGGHGAVRLLASAPEHRAMLIERCLPGTQLWQVEDDAEATTIAAGAMRRLWRPLPAEHPYPCLADAAARWAADLPQAYEAKGASFDRSLLDEAVEACRALGPTQGQMMLLHQDLHGGNILRAQREPWLIIDPQPMAGEREFDVASLLRDRRPELAKPGGAAIVQRRLDILAGELGLDRQRARLWGIAHAIAWAKDDVSGRFDPSMVHAARLIAQAK